MKTAFRDLVRHWARQAYYGEPVVVAIHYRTYGGERGAYAECRRIATAFASLRTWERKLANKRSEAADTPYLEVTPYEDVICRHVHVPDQGRYEVHFTELDNKALEEMYPQIGGMGIGTTEPVE